MRSPPVAVRLRRDFRAVLGLIRAHALLHRATRQTDDRGRVVAEIDDYTIVRDLVLELVSDGVGATVRPETRETVEAVEALRHRHEAGVPQKAIVEMLGTVDKSAVSRRVRVALEAGYLVNLEDRRGRPHRLDLGETLPDDLELLPPPDRLNGCTVARLSEPHTPVVGSGVDPSGWNHEEAELFISSTMSTFPGSWEETPEPHREGDG